MIGKLLMAIFLTLSLISASCASHTLVSPEPLSIQTLIRPGDTVEIVTKDTEETSFVVVEVTDEAIVGYEPLFTEVGEYETVLFTDITKLQKQTDSAEKNFLNIAIIILAVASFAVLPFAGGAGGYYCY